MELYNYLLQKIINTANLRGSAGSILSVGGAEDKLEKLQYLLFFAYVIAGIVVYYISSIRFATLLQDPFVLLHLMVLALLQMLGTC
jgi:preprotein translocase subunit SecG